MKIKIKFFAVSKDYFGNEMLLDVATINGLKEYLINQNISSVELLNTCKFAVNNAFVQNSYVFKNEDVVAVLPPSSGG